MKIDAATLEAMRELIAPLDTPAVRERYIAGDFPRAEQVKDLNRRYRWDLCISAGAYRLAYDIGAHDAHIETALRRIVPALV